jgi:hypothetical protein
VRRFDELPCVLVRREERLDLGAPIQVDAAGLLQKRFAPFRRELERGVVQIAGFPVSLRIHQTPPRFSS